MARTRHLHQPRLPLYRLHRRRLARLWPEPVRPRAKPPSRLEARFELLWRAQGGPELEKEFRFHPIRKWRADFAHLESRTLADTGRYSRLHGLNVRALRFFSVWGPGQPNNRALAPRAHHAEFSSMAMVSAIESFRHRRLPPSTTAPLGPRIREGSETATGDISRRLHSHSRDTLRRR
jgi:hypothetical protein